MDSKTKLLSYNPSTSIEKGMDKFVRWHLENNTK